MRSISTAKATRTAIRIPALINESSRVQDAFQRKVKPKCASGISVPKPIPHQPPLSRAAKTTGIKNKIEIEIKGPVK